MKHLKGGQNHWIKGAIRPLLNTKENFLLMTNGSIRPFKDQKIICSSKTNPFLLKVKLHGFKGNTLYDIKELGCTYKNTHISAATQPSTLNLVSN